MRVVSEVRPWYIVMENVPGIITMKKGAVKDEICQAFVNIGYSNVSVAILESAAYGVPQIRPRTFFIANKFGKINPYPKPQLLPHQYKPIESAISDLPELTPFQKLIISGLDHSQEYMERLAQVPPDRNLSSS